MIRLVDTNVMLGAVTVVVGGGGLAALSYLSFSENEKSRRLSSAALRAAARSGNLEDLSYRVNNPMEMVAEVLGGKKSVVYLEELVGERDIPLTPGYGLLTPDGFSQFLRGAGFSMEKSDVIGPWKFYMRGDDRAVAFHVSEKGRMEGAIDYMFMNAEGTGLNLEEMAGNAEIIREKMLHDTYGSLLRHLGSALFAVGGVLGVGIAINYGGMRSDSLGYVTVPIALALVSGGIVFLAFSDRSSDVVRELSNPNHYVYGREAAKSLISYLQLKSE